MVSTRPQLLKPEGGPGRPYSLDGRPLVGVTSVIHEVLRAPQLEEWFKRTGMAANEIRDEAGRFGTSIHAAMAAHVGSRKLMRLELPASWWLTVEAGQRWIEQNVAEVYAAEESIASSKYGYAGTPDLYCRRVNHTRPCLVDYKTTGALYWGHRAQLAAYRQAVKETYGDRGVERVVLRFSKDEPGRIYEHPLDNPDKDFALFGYLLGAYHIIKGGVT